MPKYRVCPSCYGVGVHQHVESGILMGILMGTDYAPQTRICLRCLGTGQVDDK